MKTIFKNSLHIGLLAFFVLSNTSLKADPNHPDPIMFSIIIPDGWQSYIVRQDYENQTIFSLRNGNESPVFLFSVSKVTYKQWLAVHRQLSNVMVAENKDGYVVYIEKTTEAKIKGAAAVQYQQLLPQLSNIIQSIEVKG